MKMPPLHQEFVLHFGEMGSRWGINRTVGQIYALLFLSAEALNADQITEALGISRSNTSMGLKELQAWRLVRLKHVPGDRKDHFTTPDDLWEIVRILIDERKKREIDPTLLVLSDLSAQLEGRDDVPAHIRERIERMHTFMGTLTGWFDDVRKLPKGTLVSLMKLGSKVARFIPTRNQTGG